MKITTTTDATHVLVTFEAETALEGYQLGCAATEAKQLGANIALVSPMLQIAYPKRPKS